METGTLDGLLGFHLRMAHAAMQRDFDRTLGPVGITQMQFAVLELLRVNRPVAQTDLAATLGTDRATMMALVDRLEARGWVVRQVALKDRRRQDILLTDPGRGVLEQARELILAHERRFVERLGERGRQTVQAALRRLYEPD